MRLVLFDIDGTLLLTGGAGSRALGKTMDRIYGLQGSMQGIKPDGKTDPAIVAEALARHEIEVQESEMEQIFAEYVAVLEAELALSDIQVLPGVTSLLSRLAKHPEIRLGVATGNVEAGAHIKLRSAGLLGRFAFGGFGSDAWSRTEMIRTAIRRGKELESNENTVEAVFLVGDTPRDIRHGKRAGAQTIAVATGSYSARQLSRYDPTLLVENLDPIDPILKLISS